jgi:hypothetical protein
MAPSLDQTNQELAKRLIDHADSITNAAAQEMEEDIRLAAQRLRHADDQTPLVPRLVGELRRIAFNALDLDTKKSLQALLGEMGG